MGRPQLSQVIAKDMANDFDSEKQKLATSNNNTLTSASLGMVTAIKAIPETYIVPAESHA